MLAPRRGDWPGCWTSTVTPLDSKSVHYCIGYCLPLWLYCQARRAHGHRCARIASVWIEKDVTMGLPLINVKPFDVDFVEAGSAVPLVVLVHSSVSGARQWRRLMEDLKNRFRVRAVNLFGY